MYLSTWPRLTRVSGWWQISKEPEVLVEVVLTDFIAKHQIHSVRSCFSQRSYSCCLICAFRGAARSLWRINAVFGDWIGSLLSCLSLSLPLRAEELVSAKADQVMCTCSDAAPGSSSGAVGVMGLSKPAWVHLWCYLSSELWDVQQQ